MSPARGKLLCIAASGALAAFLAYDAFDLGLGDDVVRWWSERWVRRLEHGEEMLAQGRHQAAADYLARLDREFPARHAKHALDRHRERLLRALAEAYARTGRPGRERETYQQLVTFDPRNFLNHHDLALCLLRQGKGGDAEAPLREALAIHPAHLPSFTELIDLLADAKRHTDVMAQFEAYLDATTFTEVTATAGEQQARAAIPIDGRRHTVRLSLPAAPSASSVAITTGEHAWIEGVRTQPVQRAGIVGAEQPQTYQPTAATRAFEVPGGPIAALDVEATTGKPIHASTLDLIETSYRSALRPEALEALLPRIRVVEDGR